MLFKVIAVLVALYLLYLLFSPPKKRKYNDEGDYHEYLGRDINNRR